MNNEPQEKNEGATPTESAKILAYRFEHWNWAPDAMAKAIDAHAREQCREKCERMNHLLKHIRQAAEDKAGDVMTDPTWNLDYSFEFTLTVKQLREIDSFLKIK